MVTFYHSVERGMLELPLVVGDLLCMEWAHFLTDSCIIILKPLFRNCVLYDKVNCVHVHVHVHGTRCAVHVSPFLSKVSFLYVALLMLFKTN